MKHITFAVPCYNSAAYMEKCIESLLAGGDGIEIIIVNDGSTKDNTASIADGYAEKYPSIIRAVHKENGGHGDAVMTALNIAEGNYFKVVDSDDWVDRDALEELMGVLRKEPEESAPDAFVVNYVYEHAEDNTQKIIKYEKEFPVNRNFTFSETKKMPVGKFLAMHSMIYKTELLKSADINLPKHTFYVDNLFVYKPLPLIKTFRYLNINFYRYYIGRSDQSVAESVIMNRIDQHIKVTYMIIDAYRLSDFEKTDPKLYKYMLSFVSIMMTINSIYLIKQDTKESFEKKRKLWNYLKEKDKRTHRKCKNMLTGMAESDNKFICGLCKSIYVIVRKIFKFN
ncbi:MAG: glycosyltransferase family 2 protein [Clostridia bacterium]|nr:glycosyltransferase family 2 protein [Clostridia bacterium]